MSSESLESDSISSKEDIELTEFARRPAISSESGSSTDNTASRRWPTTRIETSEDEANDSAISFLNSSDENHTLDIRRTSLQSLEDISSGALTEKTSSLEGSAIRRVSSLNPLGAPSARRFSSLNTLEEPSTRRFSSLNTLEEPSTRRVSSLDPLEGLSKRRVSSLDPLEGPAVRKVSSLDPLEGHLKRRVSSLDPLEGPSTRTDWISDSEEGSLTSVYQSYYSETETNDHFDSTPPTERIGCCFGTLVWLNSFLRRYSRQIRHSVYYPLFLAALIPIPYSAGYMGCIFRYLCEGCPQLPLLLGLEGLLGMLILCLQLITVLSKRYFSPHLTGKELDNCMVVLCFVFFLLLIVEMPTTYMCEPVFIPPHVEFCAKVFYNYAYYVNFAVPIILLLLMLIHIPGYYDPAEITTDSDDEE